MRMKNDEEPLEETVTMNTRDLVGILAVANMAEEAGILPGGYKGFQKTVYDELSFQNSWIRNKRDDLMDEVKARFEILRTNKFLEDDIKERETEAETNANNYDHPKRYTGEDGKDLIDRFEEGLIPEEQVRGFLRGNVFKYLTRYPDKYGMDDLLKANEYLRRLIAFEDGGDNDD